MVLNTRGQVSREMGFVRTLRRLSLGLRSFTSMNEADHSILIPSLFSIQMDQTNFAFAILAEKLFT